MMGPRVRRSLGEAAGSAACFCLAALTALLAVNDQVREQIVQTATDGHVAAWGRQVPGLITVFVGAGYSQAASNAPLFAFAVVAGLLLLFMLRT
jgi:hypothetical protein